MRRYPKNWLIMRTNWEAAREAAPFVRGRVLDVGCGDRPYEELLRPLVKRYIGIDRPSTLHGNCSVETWADASRLPFRSESFESVCAFQVLEHIAEPSEALAEMSRVLVEGGHAVLTTPFMWGLHEEPYDFFRYTSHGLRHLCEQNGLKVVSVKPLAALWAVMALRASYALSDRMGERVVMRPILVLFQLIGGWLDRLWPVPGDPSSYLTIARKIGRCADRSDAGRVRLAVRDIATAAAQWR